MGDQYLIKFGQHDILIHDINNTELLDELFKKEIIGQSGVSRLTDLVKELELNNDER
ncbi:hypothetical protein [Lunatibacter salilacus]|uniref:hypothetical protein n=1 Tax=Lunatibacter salilacus TaxID=2483804 RepID=UPI00131B5E16|nr:hypothetical protein [Lunatibacter salilacus]